MTKSTDIFAVNNLHTKKNNIQVIKIKLFIKIYAKGKTQKNIRQFLKNTSCNAKKRYIYIKRLTAISIALSRITVYVPHQQCHATTETVGICAILVFLAFLADRGNMTTLLDHIDYAAKLLGNDHMAIETDAPNPSPYNQMQMKKFAAKPLTQRRNRDRYWQPSDPPHGSVWRSTNGANYGLGPTGRCLPWTWCSETTATK